jgi:hypothetical protein
MLAPENSPAPDGVINIVKAPPAPTGADSPPTWLEKVRALRHRLPLVVRLPLAVFFLALGIIGGFVPILQGWIFVLAAFWLLFPDHAEQFVEKIKRWFAKFKKRKM